MEKSPEIGEQQDSVSIQHGITILWCPQWDVSSRRLCLVYFGDRYAESHFRVTVVPFPIDDGPENRADFIEKRKLSPIRR